MDQIPTLLTPRLTLRPLNLEDAPIVQRLAGEWEIAETTERIPHPYENGMAEEWIRTQQQAFNKKESVALAITLKADSTLIGAIGFEIDQPYRCAEIGYWIGMPYWGHGYCTEAASEMLRYAFQDLGMKRVQGRTMTKNPASGRVLEKIGMKLEGITRQSIFRFDNFEDVAIYSMLREEHGEGASP